MSGLFIGKFEMEIKVLILLTTIVLSLLILFFLSYLLRTLIKQQIDDKMKKMIPINAIRRNIGIKIKWRK